ncbi:hypothetical protein Ahy_A08g037458 isoform A [Arachis hypogaea]|uniref:Remorin C-terminal domain-containing protein n=1 Tax=Arachis hypogaea TaxID=3818 RepID=A0A445BQV4_ARAHY|nr:hypothetical protein Ahy_A08g037458 isoform A [Arachis hypogaea]
MAEQPTKVETPPAPLVTDPPLAEAPPQLQDAAEKKPLAPPPAAAAEGTKALVVVENEKAVEPVKKKTSLDRESCYLLDFQCSNRSAFGRRDRGTENIGKLCSRTHCFRSDLCTCMLCSTDIALAEVEKEKKLSYVKAWEESEKSKAENKAQKQLSAVGAWENSKKAALEAKLRKIEEQLEKKKAEYGEQMKNKIALIHKQAEEKRAMVEAKRGEEFLKAEETAAKYRATGTTPKKVLGCF